MLERHFGYKPSIPKDVQERYETALMRVYRWRGGEWSEKIHETDMDHVRGMFWILENIKKSCPTLSSDVDIETVQHMIYIHDAGEIIVGDLTHNRKDYHDLRNRWKSRERAAFRLLTARDIKDTAMQLQVRRLYQRYTQMAIDDKEALLTDFIDKIQGSRFGFENVFNGRGMKKQHRQMQFNHTVELLVRSGRPLLQLVSGTTQADLKAFLQSELENFSRFGYRREALPYIKNLHAILQ